MTISKSDHVMHKYGNVTEIWLKFGLMVVENHLQHIFQLLTDCTRSLFTTLALTVTVSLVCLLANYLRNE